ncbi:hypothetical protein GUJ93_ZPchr0013g34780, partial [Zizania palustris]
METDAKFDILIKKLEEAEIERKVEGLQSAVDKLQLKVEKLEDARDPEEDRGIPLGGSFFSVASGGSEAAIKLREEAARSEATLTPPPQGRSVAVWKGPRS